MNAGEVSVTSVSTVIIDDYRTPPPAYSVVFKNPVFEGDDKLPSYEETVWENNNNNSRSDDGVENRRFWFSFIVLLLLVLNMLHILCEIMYIDDWWLLSCLVV